MSDNIHILHIGKTGGTAVKYALEGWQNEGPYKLFLHRHPTHLDHVPEGDKFVFFVRSPIGRFVSGFYSRKRQGRPRIFHPWAPAEREAFMRFETPNQLAEALASRDEFERTKAEEAMRAIGHVRSSYWQWFISEEYFKSRIDDLFFWGWQERLDTDFDLLRRKLHLPDTVCLPTDSTKAHRNPSGCDYTISEKGRIQLMQWYHREYAFLELLKEVAPR